MKQYGIQGRSENRFIVAILLQNKIIQFLANEMTARQQVLIST
jgi:hypothetical protein